jgi:hypothetical protein
MTTTESVIFIVLGVIPGVLAFKTLRSTIRDIRAVIRKEVDKDYTIIVFEVVFVLVAASVSVALILAGLGIL